VVIFGVSTSELPEDGFLSLFMAMVSVGMYR